MATELIVNGDMETGDPPSNWTLYDGGTGASWSRESSEVHGDTYSGKLITGTAWGRVVNDFNPGAGGIGTTYAFGGWVKTSSATRAYMIIRDNNGQTNSPYHSGSGNWEFLSVQRKIAAGVTVVLFDLQHLTGGITSYWDDVTCIAITSLKQDTGTNKLSIKEFNGLASASVKTINGLTNA